METKIKIQKYPVQLLEHFDNDDNSLGYLNNLEHLRLRVELKNSKQAGYYLIFNNEKIFINEKGKCSKFPDGMYDEYNKLLTKLVKP